MTDAALVRTLTRGARHRRKPDLAGEALKEQFRHVYWIGGGSAAGKSTIARRIASQHGQRVYSTDDVMSDHARRSSREDSPLLHRFIAMDMDERWVNRSPRAMFETFHWFSGEGFKLIVEDVLSLKSEADDVLDPVPYRETVELIPPHEANYVEPGSPHAPRVLVEGFRLLPHLVKPLLFDTGCAVWLLPTTEFREAVIESRGGSAWGFLCRTTDPERALRNLLERDRIFTEMLREETARLELKAIEVDIATTEDDLAQRVTEIFGL